MVKIKPYHYLVSFTHYHQKLRMFITGNFGLDREHPINDMNDIRDIEKFIETNYKYVTSIHEPRTVAFMHYNNIKKFLNI